MNAAGDRVWASSPRNCSAVESHAAGLSRKEIVEAMSIGLVVGGTIVIPHLRRAVEFLDDLEGPQS